MAEQSGGLINKDAAIAIDTQYADTAKTCVDGLKQKSGGRTLDAVFNTHHHADHTGGNAVFRAEAKRLIAQANVPELQRKVAAATANAPAPTVADATFDKTWSEKFGDETITGVATTARDTPTATPSSVSTAPTWSTWATSCSTSAIPASIAPPARQCRTGS